MRNPATSWKKYSSPLRITEPRSYLRFGGNQIMEQFVSQSRKYNVGLIMANQTLAQIDRKLTEILMASTETKFAGGLSPSDTTEFAKAMHTTTDYLNSVTKKSERNSD